MKLSASLILFACAVTFGPANAETSTVSVHEIIEKVEQAYGGDALLKAKSLTIIDHNKSPWAGQSENPTQLEIWRVNEELTIDFQNKRKTMVSWRVSRSGKDLDRFVFDGERGRVYDILNNKYTDDDWYNYENIGASVVRGSDTMIAKSLSTVEKTAVYEGEAFYRGDLHHMLKVKLGKAPAYTLFIHQRSGLIRKMERQHPSAGLISYIFSNHQSSDGIAYAQDMNYFVGGKIRGMSVERGIKLNTPVESLFSQPPGFESWGEVLDTSKHTVRKVADGVYHAGQGRSFTMFVDVGNYFIASGGERGLRKNLAAVNKFAGHDKPLKFFIASHHHSEHIRILTEVIELGASIVTVEAHLKTIKQSIDSAVTDERFILVNNRMSLGDGKLEVIDIATAHSEHYLLVYMPKDNLAFTEDLIETQLKLGLPRVHHDF